MRAFTRLIKKKSKNYSMAENVEEIPIRKTLLVSPPEIGSRNRERFLPDYNFGSTSLRTKRFTPSNSVKFNADKDVRSKKARSSHPAAHPIPASPPRIMPFNSAPFLHLFNRTTSKSVRSYELSAYHETALNVLAIRTGDILCFYDSQTRFIVPRRLSLFFDIPQRTSMILEAGGGIYHVPRFEISQTHQICICATYGDVDHHFLCISFHRPTISPKDFYTLVLEKDPSRAYQTLKTIPLLS